jgi:hypothetical protein
MVGEKLTKNIEMPDTVTDLGRIYLIILLITGAIFAFIAVTNINDQVLFKLAMIYSVLLIFGFLGILSDKMRDQLGIDSLIWDGSKLKLQIGVGLIFIAGWYLLFMNGGLSLATPQSVGVAFSTSPTLNWFIMGVLAPIAENCFFFGVLNITMIYIVKYLQDNPSKSLVLAGLVMASYFVLTNVPNILFILAISAGSIAAGSMIKSPAIRHIAPIIAAAAFIGGAVFPKFHSYAYQLNESNYIAASWFGFFVCLLAGFVGILPVDMAHIFNNVAVIG